MARKISPEKRERFLSSALHLFVEKGVNNTSTAEIATAAGTAAGTLFLYFPTKPDLVNELVLKIGKEQSESINTLLDPSLSARQAFAVIWNGSVRWFIDHMDAYLFIQQVRDSGIIAPKVVQESNQYFRYYYDAIEKGLQEGSLKPYPVELIGGILYQGIVAVMNLVKMQPGPARQKEYIDQGFAIFWDGIKT